jgi:hemerythrin-like metal-binding protein
MTILSWKPAYETGMPEIDAEHQAMFACINQLHDSATGNGPREAGVRLIQQLVDYAERHFAREEELMQNAGFPDLDEHRRQHHEARQTVHRFRNDYLDGRNVAAVEVLAFLSVWIDEHILGTDFAYVRHLAAQPQR